MQEFMAKDILGVVFCNATATFLARISNESGIALTIADIQSVYYSIFLIDDQQPTILTAVNGHENISLPVSTIFFDTLQTGDIWKVDTTGYNFRHSPEANDFDPFPISHHHYLVHYKIVPTTGLPIIVRFRVNAI